MLQIGRTTILDFIICVLKKESADFRHTLLRPTTAYNVP